MIFPSWRQSLARSLHVSRSKPEAKFFQAANAYLPGDNLDGKNVIVENRTMVHRGFVDNTQTLLAITDIRSDKVFGWQLSASTQLCWYFTKSREQYRISANVFLIGSKGFITNNVHATNSMWMSEEEASKIRSTVWSNLSEKSKSQFYWPAPKHALGQSVAETEEKNIIPTTFCVVCFDPYYVDYVNLTTEPQTREIHQLLDAKWTHSTVNP